MYEFGFYLKLSGHHLLSKFEKALLEKNKIMIKFMIEYPKKLYGIF